MFKKMEDIEVILFDLGGVLVELSGVSTMLRWSALTVDGKPLDEQSLWRCWLNSPAVRRFETGQISAQTFADQLIEEMHLKVDRQTFLDAFTAWPSGLFPGVPALLNKLRDRYTLACLSNTSELHWPRLMKEMALESHLDHHFGSHLIGKIKPDRECFDHVIEALTLQPEQILFFDDNLINVEGERKAGMQALHVRGIEALHQTIEHHRLIKKN